MTDTPVQASPPAAALARYTTAPDPGPLLALNFGFARARALGTALELGVFTELARGPRGTEDLAGALGCDPRALGDLLAALTEFGLLTGDGRGLTELSRAYLVEGEPTYLGDHFTEVLGQWDRWSALTSVTRSGDRSGDFGAPASRGRHPGLFGGGFPLAVRVAFAAVEALGLRGAGRVLDLACGGGEWGIALAAADPRAEVTAHDDPVLLGSARARAAEFGVADRFRFVSADFAAPPFADAGFDTVVLAHAGRFAGPTATARLVRECARLLRPGGTLLLADVMRPEPGRPALSRPMLGLSLLVNTADGAVLAAEDYRALMEDAGVTAKECVTHGLVTAQTGERR
ncbi:methyltransferase domain-containing protein [Streptomyces sp. NBC_00457]|uniref:class I SAM-dependent methyltransferase n=1 Tax=unclassified Streptomyces TaxID=2593676 RepID=UPI002E1A72A4|nr:MULTISPECIES: class I SAM-dependent methyltransferase [unclassified Streptomyces]